MPRTATQRALAELVALLRSGDSVVRLVGPPGLGKSRLLAQVPEALGPGWRCVLLDDPTLSCDALWPWVARRLGPRAGRAEAVVERAAWKATTRGAALLLLVDDAHLHAPDTMRRLALACSRVAGLRVLLCETQTEPDEEDEEARPGEVWLTEPLSGAEASAFVRAWLETSPASNAAKAPFTDAAISALHRQAAGNPAALRALCDELLGVETPRAREAGPDPLARWAKIRSATARRSRRAARILSEAAVSLLTAVASALRRAADHGVDGGRRGWARATSLGVRTLAIAARPRTRVRLARIGVVAAIVVAGFHLGTLLGEQHDATHGAGAPMSAAPRVAAPPPLRIGRLNVNAIPWATIEIDGDVAGETPLGEIELARGVREVIARFPDGRVVRRRVEIGAQEVFLVLRPDEAEPRAKSALAR